jgi:hypothetical protein
MCLYIVVQEEITISVWSVDSIKVSEYFWISQGCHIFVVGFAEIFTFYFQKYRNLLILPL